MYHRNGLPGDCSRKKPTDGEHTNRVCKKNLEYCAPVQEARKGSGSPRRAAGRALGYRDAFYYIMDNVPAGARLTFPDAVTPPLPQLPQARMQ